MLTEGVRNKTVHIHCIKGHRGKEGFIQDKLESVHIADYFSFKRLIKNPSLCL